jgi:hypothetical protein
VQIWKSYNHLKLDQGEHTVMTYNHVILFLMDDLPVNPSMITSLQFSFGYSWKTREKRPRESILRREFDRAIKIINNDLPGENHLRFLHWDLHKNSQRY